MSTSFEQRFHRYVQVVGVFILLAVLAGCDQGQQPDSSQRQETRSATPKLPGVRRYDLERDEHRGGHTLARHVARTDEQLQERLRRERNISAASTWTDFRTAEETVATALHTEHGQIERWMGRGERRPNLALHYDAGHPIGRSLRRDSSEVVMCTAAVIVLRADGPDGYYVLTTYPEARE